MTAALAPAPAAPTTPMEEDTVATITGQDGTTTQYKSFDEAVSKANNGDTIEVIKDATSTGIDLRDKKLTIKGKTVTTTTDSGTEEKTTVKPKLKFVAKEGQSQIAGITLWGSDLTFQNMDVNMKGASSTTYNKWNAVCMSDNASLTLNRTDLSMDGTGLDASAQGIYMAGRGRNELNVEDHSTLTINNYYNGHCMGRQLVRATKAAPTSSTSKMAPPSPPKATGPASLAWNLWMFWWTTAP